jgi:hypothetical protein
MLNRPLDHRSLLQFLLAHEVNLVDPTVLVSMASVKATSTVNYESDIRDEGKQVGILFKTTAGEELKRFPKQFDVRLPILEADEGADRVDVLTIRLEITLPDTPNEKPKFTLYCSNWRSKHKERIEREGEKIAKALDGWTVVHGKYQTRQHELAKPQPNTPSQF